MGSGGCRSPVRVMNLAGRTSFPPKPAGQTVLQQLDDRRLAYIGQEYVGNGSQDVQWQCRGIHPLTSLARKAGISSKL